MKRVFKTIIAVLCFTAVACTDYQVDIDNLNDRIDSLEKTQIANITQQIASINSSLPMLENADTELKTLIASMQKTIEAYRDVVIENESKLAALKTEIEASIEALRANIEASRSADKKEMLESLNAAKAEIEAQLAALQTEAGSKFEQMNDALTALRAKDAGIEARIDSLKAFVSEELTSTKDWATKTFATLAQQQAIQDDISAIKGSITALQTSLTDMEKRLTEKYDTAIQNAVSSLEGKISESAAAITEAYKAAIKTAKDEITVAYEAEIASSIKELEDSLKDWVSSTLTSYYTKSETSTLIDNLDKKLSAQLATQLGYITALQNALGDTKDLKKTIVELIKANEAAISANASAISTLRKDLNDEIAKVTKAYQEAITDAINKSVEKDGTVDKAIAAKISEYNTELQKTITSINSSIESLKTRVGDLEKDVETLTTDLDNLTKKVNAFIGGRIQSLTYIPRSMNGEYLAGMTNLDAYGDFILRFEVNPASMVKNITDLKQLSATVSYVEPYAGSKNYGSADVKSFKIDETNGVLEVTVAAKDVFTDQYDLHRAAISVSVKDVTNSYYDVASEFIYLNAQHFFVRYTTTRNDQVFNPYKFEITDKGNTTRKYDDATMRETLLGHLFVEAPDYARTLDMQFTDSYTNPDITSLTFGSVADPKTDGYGHGLPSQIKLKSGRYAFTNLSMLNYVDMKSLDVTDVTTFERMFQNCRSLKNVLIDGEDVGKVESMVSMFSGSGLDTLSLRNWKTGSLKDATNMFIGCKNLKTVDLRGWDVSKLTDLTGMFADSPNLTKIKMDWKKFSSDPIKLFATFRGTGITKVDQTVPSIKINSLLELFKDCAKLETVKLQGTPTIVKGGHSAIDIREMFMGCTKLTSVDLTGWKIDGKADLTKMFYGCSELTTITLDGWKLTGDTVITDMLTGCTKLTTVNVKNCDDATWAKIGDAVNTLAHTVSVNRK